MKYVLIKKNRKGVVYVEQMMHGFSTTKNIDNAIQYEESEVSKWLKYGKEEFNQVLIPQPIKEEKNEVK